MKSISGKKLCKVVERFGWKLARIKGSHYIYTKENVSAIIVIPTHVNRDLPIGTLKGILKDLKMYCNLIKYIGIRNYFNQVFNFCKINV